MHRSPEWNFAGRLVDRLGENSALIEAGTGQTLRAKEIAERIVGFAAGFLSNGLRASDPVLISCSLNPSSALAYLGAMYAGCVPILVDERTHAASGEVLVTKANAKAAWTPKPVQWDWARKNGFPQMEGNFDPCPADSLQASPSSKDDLAALMPTSGSTGVPRLVMVSHGNLIANTEAIIRSQHLASDEKAMLIMPVSYCFGASILHTHLYRGGGSDQRIRLYHLRGCPNRLQHLAPALPYRVHRVAGPAALPAGRRCACRGECPGTAQHCAERGFLRDVWSNGGHGPHFLSSRRSLG
jgi:acyl-CoA synthetase (AMP-forming)/AMP-acid ligase II